MHPFFHGAFGSVDDITHQLSTGGIDIIAAGLAHDHRISVFHQHLGETIDPAVARFAIGIALNIDQKIVQLPFDEMWQIFLAPEVTLKDKSKSDSFSYIVRRSMYTPRSLRAFIKFSLDISDRLPVPEFAIQDAEISYSTDQLEFLKTEFGGLCAGLDICLQSFTGKPLEWIASDLYKHLRGHIGNGQVTLQKGVSYGDSYIALARFLYRIGFLEVRYPQDGRYEVRDVMRHPDHWKSVRADDAVRWAVRSAFFNGLKSYRA